MKFSGAGCLSRLPVPPADPLPAPSADPLPAPLAGPSGVSDPLAASAAPVLLACRPARTHVQCPEPHALRGYCSFPSELFDTASAISGMIAPASELGSKMPHPLRAPFLARSPRWLGNCMLHTGQEPFISNHGSTQRECKLWPQGNERHTWFGS